MTKRWKTEVCRGHSASSASERAISFGWGVLSGVEMTSFPVLSTETTADKEHGQSSQPKRAQKFPQEEGECLLGALHCSK